MDTAPGTTGGAQIFNGAPHTEASNPNSAAPATNDLTRHRSHGSSGNTLNDDERDTVPEMREKRSANSSSDHVAELGGRGVSVRRGKEEFAALERRFSNLSQRSQELQRQNTRRSSFGAKTKQVESADPEKGEKPAAAEEEFDLAATLREGQQKSDEAGIKHKNVGVVWEDLEVVGAGGLKINIRNFVNAIIEQFLMPILAVLGLFGFKPFASKPKSILNKNSGMLKPGEMCLVLGRPGSGCSTFLKAITNQRDSYLEVNGNVEYAGLGWKEMKKRYAGLVLSHLYGQS